MTKLEVVPAAVFSSTFDVREDGAPLGRIVNKGFFRDRGTLETGGRSFAAYRERGLRTTYALESQGGAIVTTAEREGLLREAYHVRFGGREVILKKKAFAMRKTFAISDGSGEIGSIARASLLSRRLLFEVAAREVPPEISLFLIWIAIVVQRRDSSASAS